MLLPYLAERHAMSIIHKDAHGLGITLAVASGKALQGSEGGRVLEW